MTRTDLLFLILACIALMLCYINVRLAKRLMNATTAALCMYYLLANVTGLDDEELAEAIVRAGIEHDVDSEDILWALGIWD